jgi:hypothetical protein
MRHLNLILAAAMLTTIAAGCDDEPDYDLPAGWEGALHVEVFQGPEGEDCDAYDPPAEVVAAGLHEGAVRLVYEHAVFNCAEDHEAFVRERQGGYDVLLQPIDMNPDALAGCMCAYRVRIPIGTGAAGTEVSLFRRNNREVEEDPQPWLVEAVAVGEEEGDCAGLASCNVETGCEFEGQIDGLEFGCVELPSCGGAFCVYTGEACTMECGEPTCQIMESYPVQVGCD